MRDPKTTLLFDWDGTLFDSATRGFEAFDKTFRELGVEFSKEVYDACYSPNWYTMYETLNLPSSRWREADDLWIRHYGEEPAELVDGAGEMLFALNRKGYRLGVVSSGSQRRVIREIYELGLASIFGTVVCNEDITNKKPHPEGLEKAMDSLNAARLLCAYVGDAPEDIQMGKNAGVQTVGVRSAYPTSKLLKEAGPDIHLESITELLLHF
jgi:HAD superfamily hydrolase (TIGR01662 family)